MRFDKCALLCAILALSILEPIAARKGYSSGGGSRHSYPKTGSGLSGHGGGSHGYPSSGGLSGGGHGYPSSGGSGSHAYPSSGGLSGGGRGYPSSGGNNHGYPSSGGNSHGYPSSGGLSGNNNRGYPKTGQTSTTTNVHHHYHYSPPQQISYAPYRGAPAVSYPVYRGTPPTYVYQYKDSGSKYGTLLAGLALLNLGALAGTAYAVSQAHNNNNGHSSYKSQPGEVCKFGLKKGSDYEETRIDCQLITSFIFQEQAKTQGSQNNTSIITTTTVTNVTMINNTNPLEPAAAVNQTATKVLYEMLPNGTLVPVNVPVNSTEIPNPNITNPTANNTMTSSVITTTTNRTTVTNALDVKGKPIDVTPDMECYVIRTTPSSRMRKAVPCGLLQTYADKSISRNSAMRSIPTFTIISIVLAAFVIN